MWSGKLLVRVGLGCYIILRDTMKTPVDNEEYKTKEDAIIKELNKKAYNELVLAQDDTVCFHIVE